MVRAMNAPVCTAGTDCAMMLPIKADVAILSDIKKASGSAIARAVTRAEPARRASKLRKRASPPNIIQSALMSDTYPVTEPRSTPEL